MITSLIETLCTECGLCCDGSLFADVELAGRSEATQMEAMGLEVEDSDTNGALLVQPCAALKGTRCAIYAHRPKCCRTFECRLLHDVRRGTVGVERAKSQIAEARRQIRGVRSLLARLGPYDGHLPLRESCAEALAKDRAADPRVSRTCAELEAAMSAVDGLIRRTFLADAKPPSHC